MAELDLKAGGGDDRGRDGWMASLTQWTWVWASSGSWWWPGKPGVLQSLGSQRVGHDWVTDLNCCFQLLSHVQLFVTPWTEPHQAFLSITNSQDLLKLTSIESVVPSSHLILCHPVFLLPPIPPSIRVFSKESTLHMKWPKYWSFSFSIIPSKEILGINNLKSYFINEIIK